MRGQRPCRRRATKKCDEFAPFHPSPQRDVAPYRPKSIAD
jgi:hypothetical protein